MVMIPLSHEKQGAENAFARIRLFLPSSILAHAWDQSPGSLRLSVVNWLA